MRREGWEGERGKAEERRIDEKRGMGIQLVLAGRI